MKARERFDRILLSCRDRMQEEVAALIGKPFKMGEAQFRQLSKADLFSELGSKQVLAHIRIDGEVEGAGCLLIGIEDAIAIGGTLIMLPETQLESIIADQQYAEDVQDSYGEVANIICGSVAICFEQQYSKKIRLVREALEEVVPVEVEIDSDLPIADVPYYCMTLPLQLDGRSRGNLLVVLPAKPFGLAEQPAEAKEAATAPEASFAAAGQGEDAPQEAIKGIKRQIGGDTAAEEPGVLERPGSGAASVEPQPVKAKRDVGKQKKRVDELLKNCLVKMSDEVGALLGGTVKVMPLANRAVTKEDFLDQAGGVQIMTRMEIRGEKKGEAFLFVDVKAAVYLGGALIMLPEGELEETVRSEAFSEDARDAYGEVSNIIAGVYSAIFEKQHRTRLGFVKTSIEPFVPVKIDPDSDECFANQAYYLSLGHLHCNNKDLGRIQLLIPAAVLELEDLLQAEDAAAEPGMASGVRTGIAVEPPSPSPAEPVRLREQAPGNTDILIVTDDDVEGNRIASILADSGSVTRLLHFKDQVHNVLTPHLQMVFLVMHEVSEQGFGVAIKISSAGHRIPLVAAGPAWTRTLVLKAVKYGASDILITPATPDEIREKVAVNRVRKAA